MATGGSFKVNDSHVLLDYTGPKLETIWDRHGKKPKYDFTGLSKDLATLGQTLAKHGGGRYYLDGGLMATRHSAIKGVICLWDVLVRNGQHLLGTTYQERYDWLRGLCTGADYSVKLPDGHGFVLGKRLFQDAEIVVLDNYPAAFWDKAWDLVQEVNRPFLAKGEGPLLEGLVMKNPKGKLMAGLREANNQSWIGRSRVKTKRHMF